MQNADSARWEPPEALVDRFTHQRIEALSGRLRRAMDDNPEGRAVLADAIGEAIRIGYAARVRGAHLYPPASDDEAWERWTEQWRLVEGVGEWADAPDAERALEEAGQRLDLARGWGLARALRNVGREAAAAGAALAVALRRPPEEPDADASARPSRSHEPWAQIEGSVVVGFAANQAEAELIQGRLELAGIPSALRRVASMDIPDYLAAGYREIHVPPAAADDARRLLAPADDTA
jgi:hypothetical protein